MRVAINCYIILDILFFFNQWHCKKHTNANNCHDVPVMAIYFLLDL